MMSTTPSTAIQADLLCKLNARKNRLLLVLQACLPQQHQFDAIRKILLDELGRGGFEQELTEALEQVAQARLGQEYTSKKGGAV